VSTRAHDIWIFLCGLSAGVGGFRALHMSNERDEQLSERATVTLTPELVAILRSGEWSYPVRLHLVRAEGMKLFLEFKRTGQVLG